MTSINTEYRAPVAGDTSTPEAQSIDQPAVSGSGQISAGGQVERLASATTVNASGAVALPTPGQVSGDTNAVAATALENTNQLMQIVDIFEALAVLALVQNTLRSITMAGGFEALKLQVAEIHSQANSMREAAEKNMFAAVVSAGCQMIGAGLSLKASSDAIKSSNAAAASNQAAAESSPGLRKGIDLDADGPSFASQRRGAVVDRADVPLSSGAGKPVLDQSGALLQQGQAYSSLGNSVGQLLSSFIQYSAAKDQADVKDSEAVATALAAVRENMMKLFDNLSSCFQGCNQISRELSQQLTQMSNRLFA